MMFSTFSPRSSSEEKNRLQHPKTCLPSYRRHSGPNVFALTIHSTRTMHSRLALNIPKLLPARLLDSANGLFRGPTLLRISLVQLKEIYSFFTSFKITASWPFYFSKSLKFLPFCATLHVESTWSLIPKVCRDAVSVLIHERRPPSFVSNIRDVDERAQRSFFVHVTQAHPSLSESQLLVNFDYVSLLDFMMFFPNVLFFCSCMIVNCNRLPGLARHSYSTSL